MVAMAAINGAAHRIADEPGLESRGLERAVSCLSRIKGGLAGPVSDKFHAEEQAAPANLADQRRVNLAKLFHEISAHRGAALRQLVFHQDIERFQAHRANPQDDYALFQQQVEAELREDALSTWIDKRIGETFIRVDAPYDVCTMDMPWLTESINASGAFGSSTGN